MRWRSLIAVIGYAAGAACGSGGTTAKPIAPTPPAPMSTIDRMVALLPDGAQIIVEIDLTRLRANAVVGGVVGDALVKSHASLPALSGLATLEHASAVVFAAYGVGTAQAITVALLAAHEDVASAMRLTPDIIALGPMDWVAQLATRAAIGGDKLTVPTDLRELRARAEPKGANRAVIRATAPLP